MTRIRQHHCLTALRWVLTRCGCVYLVLGGFLWTLGMSHVIGKVRAAALSRLMPDYRYLRDLERGEAAYDAGKLDEYLHYYRKLVEFLPQRAEARAVLGYVAAKAGDPKEALHQFRAGTGLNPRIFSSYYNTGVLLLRSGHYRQAAELFQQAIKTDLRDNLNYMTSSRILYPFYPQQGDLADIVRARIRSNFGKGYQGLVLSQYFSGQNFAAINTAGMALSAGVPQAAFFYYYAGRCAFEVKDYPQAVRFFQECLKRDPDHAEAVYYLAQVMQSLGRAPAARELLQRAAALHETSPQVQPLDVMDLILF